MGACVWARWREPFREDPAWFFRLLFLAGAEALGIEPRGQMARLAQSVDRLTDVCQRAFDRYHSSLFLKPSPLIDEGGAQGLLAEMADWLAQAPVVPTSFLMSAYETTLAHVPGRKGRGAYYTPRPIVHSVLNQVFAHGLSDAPPTLVDPSCGAGAFLLPAFEILQRHFGASDAILRCLHGVDLDPLAIEITKLGLLLLAAAGRGVDVSLPDLSANFRCANALLGADSPSETTGTPMDWQRAFPATFQGGGFDVVVGNPPWGQKKISAALAWKTYLRQRFPSSAGIFDLFRPFVELSVRLTAPGGAVGLVLPDIVLLKNYPQTRRFLLDSLTLQDIGWWGKAFAGAQIDVATIVGRRGPAPIGHPVRASIQQGTQCREHTIPQAEFLALPRYVFNLHLTAERLAIFRRLADCPRLGDWFEVHEGVHSGNMRELLFVDRSFDESCRELYLGRGEIRPYQMSWHGRYLYRAPFAGKTDQQYAHLGRPEWHERDKVLIRRTGDRLLAAVDEARRYASNNFFVVFSRKQGAMNLDGLCAFLNSRLATWYFRAIEPRQGRAFAELKIKHLTVFPLPTTRDGAVQLNALGAERATASAGHHARLDAAIDQLVEELLGISLPVEDGLGG